MTSASSQETIYCSFCGKSHRQVKRMVAGPGVNICSGCVDLSHEICHAYTPTTTDIARMIGWIGPIPEKVGP